MPRPSLAALVGADRSMATGGHRKGGARAQPTGKGVASKKKYKLKSHSGARKRFKLRGDGTWVHQASGKKHLMAGASRSRQTLRKRKKTVVKTKGYIRMLRRLLPYGSDPK